MATEDRQKPSCIIERLFREGYRFNFFQAVYLLERMLYPNGISPGKTRPLSEEIIRFQPNPSLGFPPTDICQIQKEQDGDGRETIKMILSFMGLYGVASPLPKFISDLIVKQEDETLELQAFLDIFNHRLYSLFYQSWKKYRYYLQFDSFGEDRFSQYMLSMLGLGTPKLADLVGIPSTRLMAYSGIIGNRAHCPEGLRGLLSDYLGGIEVDIQEFMPRWATIPERVRLGSKSEVPALRHPENRDIQAKLGENVVIGKKILDCSSKFRVALGPLNLKDYRSFLPDGANSQALYRLIRFYAPAQLDFDVELRLKKEEVPEFKLGNELAQL
ncbi:MAG: type VI secretion system baseplate subunit TssG, partial [Candidatus Poribacteria bacterium]